MYLELIISSVDLLLRTLTDHMVDWRFCFVLFFSLLDSVIYRSIDIYNV